MTLFIALNFLAAAGAFRAATRWLRYTQAAEVAVCCILLSAAQAVCVGLCLGMAGRISPVNALLLTLVITGAIFLGTRRRSSVQVECIPQKWLFALHANYAVLLLTAVLFGFALTKIITNLISAPFGWDSLNYHFTFPVEWLKSRTLDMPVTVFDDPSPSYYPINGSLIYLWLMLPLDSVFLADLGQVPFFVLGFASVYALARRFKLSSEYAFFGAVLFTLVPNYFKQLEVAYVDVMVGALFLAACLYLVRLHERYRIGDVVMFGLSLGLCVGTKSVALVYAGVLLVPFAALVIRERKPMGFAAAGTVALALGGYAYARNYFLTGNPLYPCEMTLFGKTIFPGVLDLSTVRAHMEPGKEAFAKLLFHEGMGAQTLVFVLFGMASLACAAALRRKIPLRALYWLLACPVALYLLYRYCVPLANARYLYPALGLGMVSGMYAAAHWRLARRFVQVLVAVCALVSAAETASHAELAACAVVSCVLAAGFWYSYKLSVRRLAVSFGALCLAGAVFLYPAYGRYLKFEYDSYVSAREYSGFWTDATAAWKWLNENTHGENIAYAGRPVPFPLYGTRFKNNVFYASVNEVDPPGIHVYAGSRYRWGYDFLGMHRSFEEPQNYRGRADYAAWLANLGRRQTALLFVYSLHQTAIVSFPLEDSWARQHPDVFEEVFANETVRIYRIKHYS